MCNSLSSRILGYLPRVIPNPAGYYDIYHVLYQIQRDIRISTICNTKSSRILGYLQCVILYPAGYQDIYHVLYQIQRDIRISTICNTKSSGIIGYLPCVIPPKSSGILGYLSCVIPNPAGYQDIYHVKYQIQRDIRISTLCYTRNQVSVISGI